jgi:hypothetical protein
VKWGCTSRARGTSHPVRLVQRIVYTATATTSIPRKSQNRDKKPLPYFSDSSHGWKYIFQFFEPKNHNAIQAMEADNLRTASLYINNQLLSRGLLRNGQSIEFARPDKGEGGLEATMGKIMSVVNDLILRRDVGFHFQSLAFRRTNRPARCHTTRNSYNDDSHITRRFSATNY